MVEVKICCRLDFQPCTAMVWDYLIVGLWLHHILSLANVTMATIAVGESRQISSSQNLLF
jgi:hypothetical protein